MGEGDEREVGFAHKIANTGHGVQRSGIIRGVQRSGIICGG